MAADASRNESLILRPPIGDNDKTGLLTPAAMAFIADLERCFGERRRALLAERRRRQTVFDQGDLPDFDPATRDLRESDWKVAPIPAVLRDRRVEITGPVDRKMVINALNSGARVFMADFEDSCTPTWSNLIDGQVNLRDAVAGTIAFTSPEGKDYRLHDDPAVLMVRPRGWHLDEKHVLYDRTAVSASLFDFGLFAFHNAAALHARGLGPFFYLPKIEHWREAELWEDVFTHTERVLALPIGAMKTTVLIETLPAAFQMHEILHALRRRIVALNCGRWDYIFSTIKTVRAHASRVLPERGQVVMTVPFLKAYSELLVQTCHRRGALAMGGMAAQIPIGNDADANERALAKVRADKLREVTAGHDGTWVAHPGLIPIAMAVFDEHMPTQNQLQVTRNDVLARREDLLAVPEGTITLAGYTGNIEVALRYLTAWLSGNGCVPIHHLMEDAATAEIARAQLWQWQHHGARLDDGTLVTAMLFDQVLADVLARLRIEQPATDFSDAAALLRDATHSAELTDFITLPAYARLP
jgi:malate synthase